MIYAVVYFDMGNWMKVLSHFNSADEAVVERNKLRNARLLGDNYEVIVFESFEKDKSDYAL